MDDYCQIDVKDYEIKRDGAKVSFDGDLSKICFPLLHTAAPYITSFSRNAWFSWEKDKKAVVAFCPKGFTGTEIRRISPDKVRIKVIESSGKCPRHKLNETFVLDLMSEKNRIAHCAFPCVFYLKQNKNTRVRFTALGSDGKFTIEAGQKEGIDEVDACMIEEKIMARCPEIDVVGMKRPCAYTKKMSEYPADKILPAGFCHLAYHSIYPDALSMLYHADCPDVMEACCPRGCVKLQLARNPKKFKLLYLLLEEMLRIIKPLDIISDEVSVRVTEADGTCPAKIKAGTEFVFGRKERLCPASFDGLIGGLISATDESFQCPAAQCRIKYKINDVKK